MTDLVDAAPVERTRVAASPMSRLETVVFAHARIAMLTASTDGVVVDVNAAAGELLGRPRHDLVQEPVGALLALRSGRAPAACLHEAAISSAPVSFGPCAVSRRGAPATTMELVVSSGCGVSGRNLVLLQLAPLAVDNR